jgi:predicted amino acid-binding ACT domain protein
MLILDIPRRLENNGEFIDIPVFHRTHLGLSQDTTVYFCFLPGQSTSIGSFPHINTPELIISPFNFDNWDKLWRITASLKERIGIIYDICDLMRFYNVDILATESGAMQEQDLFHIEMIVYIANENSLKQIEWAILTKLFDDINFLPDGSPRLRMRRVFNLRRTKQIYDSQIECDEKTILFKPIKDFIDLDVVIPEPVRTLRMQLPENIRNILKNHICEDNNWGYYLRISDTKDRFLRILFFRNSDNVIHARIEHSDKIGALSFITYALKQNNFNIITALSTPSENRKRTITEIIVRSINTKKISTSEVKQKIKNALSSSKAASDLKLDIGYPEKYAVKWEKERLQYSGTDEKQNKIENCNSQYELNESLKRRTQYLVNNRLIGNFSNEDKFKFTLAEKLRIQFENITSVPQKKILFISCHNKGNQLMKIKSKADALGFYVITGENLFNATNAVAELIKQIQLCTHFLGVWSEIGSHKYGKDYWPSPWLLWELGVASAFNLSWDLIISNTITEESWKKLNAPQQIVRYNEQNFSDQLEIVLNALMTFPCNKKVSLLQSHYVEI